MIGRKPRWPLGCPRTSPGWAGHLLDAYLADLSGDNPSNGFLKFLEQVLVVSASAGIDLIAWQRPNKPRGMTGEQYRRYPESLVEIHPQDAVKFGIADGSRVKVSSRRGTLEVKANVTDRTPEGTIFMNFHFKESPVNMLTNPVLDPVCKIPELKVCACKIEAA